MNKPEEQDKAEGKTYDRSQVLEIIHKVINKVEKGSLPAPEQLYTELAELANCIHTLRREVASTQAGDIGRKHIPDMTDELDAIVAATADATGTIMDSCEEIEKIAETLDSEQAEKVTGAVTQIYEACSFQDITGQRITKVVNALKTTEDKVSRLLAILQEQVNHQALETEETAAHSARPMKTQEDKDKALLQGPQKAGEAVTQDEIDRMLSEFD